MESSYRQAARKRWPGYTVLGEGEWAIVCPVVHNVTLYDFPMLAKVEMQEPHSNWDCAGHHRFSRIQREPVAQPFWQSRIWED
jgi:hypothetical protein